MAAAELPETEDLQALFDRLRHICEAMEEKNCKLEKAVELHAEGAAIEKRIRDVLDRAAKQVEEVSPDGTVAPAIIPPPRAQQKR